MRKKRWRRKRAALDADEKPCGEALLRLNIEAAAEERAGKVREEIAGVRAKIAETAAIVTVAEEKGKKEKTAQTALETIRTQFENSGKALQEARHQSGDGRP